MIQMTSQSHKVHPNALSKPTVEEVIDDDMQVPQGGQNTPNYNDYDDFGASGCTGGYVPLPHRNPVPPPQNPFLVPPQQC